MAAQQRYELLDTTQEPYICCAGLFPCGPLGEKRSRDCAWVEACCCTGLAISANRFMIQTRFDRENTPCDDCIIFLTCAVWWAVAAARCCGCDVPDEATHTVDCLLAVGSGCMLAQQQVEVEHIKREGVYLMPDPAVLESLSPFQQALVGKGRPQQQQMGGLSLGIGQANVPKSQAMGAQHVPGFLDTLAPSGKSWRVTLQGQQPSVDAQGFVGGPWGQCLAWSKVFEVQNSNWTSDPHFAAHSPSGQVIDAMLRSCKPGPERKAVSDAAGKLGQACADCFASGRPLPIINYVAKT